MKSKTRIRSSYSLLPEWGVVPLPQQNIASRLINPYNVFGAIRDNAMEQVKTMAACQQPAAQLAFKSPHTWLAEMVMTGKTAADEILVPQ
jgi:hypothetical protein